MAASRSDRSLDRPRNDSSHSEQHHRLERTYVNIEGRPIETSRASVRRFTGRVRYVRWAALAGAVAVLGLGMFSAGGSPDPTLRLATSGESPGLLPHSSPEEQALATSTSTLASTSSTTTSSKPVGAATIQPARPAVTADTTSTIPAAATLTTQARPSDGRTLDLPAGGLVFGFEAGRSVWEGTSNGTTIRVSVAPAAPVAGQVVRFSVDVIGLSGVACCTGAIGYDKSMVTQFGRTGAVCPTVPDNHFELADVYNDAGPVEFTVKAGPCTSTAGWLSGWLQVGEGRSSVQGPALPVVRRLGLYGINEHAGDTRWLPLFVQASDEDGWVDQVVVDWGDGTTPEVFAPNVGRCLAMAPNAWPRSSSVSLPAPTTDPSIPGASLPLHFYATPGTYTVKVTVRSTACDGSQPQQGTGTFRWTVAGS